MVCEAPVCIFARSAQEQASRGVSIDELVTYLQEKYGTDRVERIFSSDGDVWVCYTPELATKGTDINLSAAYR